MKEVTWKSPSNIALVKYWGKYPVQIPANPSISFTLSAATTTTTLKYAPGSGQIEVFLEGVSTRVSYPKLRRFSNAPVSNFPLPTRLIWKYTPPTASAQLGHRLLCFRYERISTVLDEREARDGYARHGLFPGGQRSGKD